MFARANVSWNASVLTSSKEKGGSEATLDQLMFTTELECQSTGVARSRAEDQGARARAATRLQEPANFVSDTDRYKRATRATAHT